MAVSPAAFFRFASENIGVVIAVFENGATDEATLSALIDRHRVDSQPSSEHIRRQLEDLRILERSAEAESVFEIAPQVGELLSWLTHRQRLSSAAVLRAHLDDLTAVGKELQQAVGTGDASLAALALNDAGGLVERLRALSEANREAMVTEAQNVRSARADSSSVERFQRVRRLWEQFLSPLQQLVDVRGEMEQRLETLRELLHEGERSFAANVVLQRALSRIAAALARMRRSAFEDHHAAIVEIAPLYDRLRRDSRWLIGAARALKTVREQGAEALGIERRLGLVGWRSRRLLSDDKLRARMAALVGYEPGVLRIATPPPIAPRLRFITREELRRAVHDAMPLRDVLDFLIATWPNYPLAAYLRAFGVACSGAFGTAEHADVPSARVYRIADVELSAWPLQLRESPR